MSLSQFIQGVEEHMENCENSQEYYVLRWSGTDWGVERYRLADPAEMPATAVMHHNIADHQVHYFVSTSTDPNPTELTLPLTASEESALDSVTLALARLTRRGAWEEGADWAIDTEVGQSAIDTSSTTAVTSTAPGFTTSYTNRPNPTIPGYATTYLPTNYPTLWTSLVPGNGYAPWH